MPFGQFVLHVPSTPISPRWHDCYVVHVTGRRTADGFVNDTHTLTGRERERESSALHSAQPTRTAAKRICSFRLNELNVLLVA